MTRDYLNPDQRRTVDIIQELGLGVIERLLIRGGAPCYEPEPRIVQEIKLDSERARQPNPDWRRASCAGETTSSGPRSSASRLPPPVPGCRASCRPETCRTARSYRSAGARYRIARPAGQSQVRHPP